MRANQLNQHTHTQLRDEPDCRYRHNIQYAPSNVLFSLYIDSTKAPSFIISIRSESKIQNAPIKRWPNNPQLYRAGIDCEL